MEGNTSRFTRQFNKEKRKLECDNSQKKYKSSAVFRKAPHPHTLEPHQGGATATTAYESFTVAIEYSTAPEEKANMQAKRMIEIEDSVGGQNVLTDTADYTVGAGQL